MNKISLFLKLYRNKKAENAILLILYSMLSAVIGMVLLVQENNSILLQNQLIHAGLWETGLESAFQGTENILGLIAVLALSVGTVGGVNLISFRNSSSRKSQVIMRIFGMEERDLILKALIDMVLFGIIPSFSGFGIGYCIFVRFTKKILQADIAFHALSGGTLQILAETFLFTAIIIFGGNLFCDMQIMDRPICETLYERQGKSRKKKACRILALTILFISAYAVQILHVSESVLKVCVYVVLLLFGILFGSFVLFFGVFTKRARRNKKICRISDISFCFLCSRNKRDALLAVVISVGTILLCIMANIRFNISGMLRSAYRDNMGYSMLLRVDSFDEKDRIREKLDEMGIRYTYAFSKLCEYVDLNYSYFGSSSSDVTGIQNSLDGNDTDSDSLPSGSSGQERELEGGKNKPTGTLFWALVIERQTDGNAHFYVPEGGFYSDNYFAFQCGLSPGMRTGLLGRETGYLGASQDHQYLSLVNYNVIINREDWKLGIDETWSPIFLIDASEAEEKRILEKMVKNQTNRENEINQKSQTNCHIESAAVLIGELTQILSDYISLILLTVSMIAVVTAAIFYTVIRTDLQSRRTEMYLYKIFGAAERQAQEIIFREYVMISLIASGAVSFTIMLCGELYFYLGLKKHFPLSVPVILMTTGAAVLMVMGCCRLTGYLNRKNAKMEVIRDE